MKSKHNSNKQSGHHRQVRVTAICIFVYTTTDCRDGGPLQMILFFFTGCYSRVRAASNICIARFHDHAAYGGHHSQSGPFQEYRGEVIGNPDFWFVKVVSTLCVQKYSLDGACLDYFSKRLTPSIALEIIRRLNNPKLALKFFEFSRVNLCLNHCSSTYNLLIRSLSEMGFRDSAKEVLDCMRVDGQTPHRSIIELLATSFVEEGKFDVAKGLIAQAEADKVAMPCFVYNKILSILVKRNRVDEAVCLFREHLSRHSHPDTCSFNIVIRGLCRIREIDKALEFFNDMESSGCSPDVITYNTLINGLCKIEEVERSRDLLKEIQSIDDFSPDIVTYTSVISGYCKLGRMDEASIIFDEMIRSGIKPNTITFNVLINGFGKSGNMDLAVKMYEKMLLLGCHPDVITFTSLIDGYCRAGQVDQALELWLELNAWNLSPNEYTFAILINALCKESRLQEAREFLKLLRQNDIVPQAFVYNPVIDGFCKAGNVDEANVIVAEMEKKRCRHDKMTYTILIIGHCMKGRMLEAISIFNKMLAIGCAPDNITISSLTSCLLKAGMPKEALRIRQLVSEDLVVIFGKK